MAEPARPALYSIAAHRGFADALVAGLAPRYREGELGLARTTLLLPSERARRTVTEAFIRQLGDGADGAGGMLLPRMAIIGDLDLDEALGSLLDPLGSTDIAPAVSPQHRLFALAALIREEQGDDAPSGQILLRLARETAATMDRLLVEDIGPERLVDETIVDIVPELSAHWQKSLRLFARVQARWLAWLQEAGMIDAAARRNRLFERAARRWRAEPPSTPVIAAGVTSAAPALARLLRVVSELPQGAVILPDLDLAMSEDVWDELGSAGAQSDGQPAFARGDAVTHPQYHLKLLLNRMGVARAEVKPWHRSGTAAAPPERSHAISNLFLPPRASRNWARLPAEKRRLAGVRLMECAGPEEEAQAVAILVREALEQPERRVAVVTPDRALARRIVNHLTRWHIRADDSAGRPLSQTPSGRVFLLAAEILGEGVRPVPLMALLGHPLVDGGMDRREWLTHVRRVELRLRGPRLAPGLDATIEAVAKVSAKHPQMAQWWERTHPILASLSDAPSEPLEPLGDLLDRVVAALEVLCGPAVWAQEDGRALAQFVEDFRQEARASGFRIERQAFAAAMADAMELVAVRPPYGGHSRVQVLGLLEARMNRADLVICAGLVEGVWPGRGAVDALLSPAILRSLGVPGAEFRIGLSAHDLAGALGAPEVVLGHARRDARGPAIPSRFVLRARALLYDPKAEDDLSARHRLVHAPELARTLARAPAAPAYVRPRPDPEPAQRKLAISATALDRLLGDPFQFYAAQVLRLSPIEKLDADPDPRWQGDVAHKVLQRWHEACVHDPAARIVPIMHAELDRRHADPLIRGLWQPRLQRALEWIEHTVRGYEDRRVAGVEVAGAIAVAGVRVHGRADRIDRLGEGGLAIIDYKSGSPPSAAMVAEGFALQLGVLGLIAEAGGFADIAGTPESFEYWSLGRAKPDNPFGFGYVEVPLKVGRKTSGITPDEFLPLTREKLELAIARYINGREPFVARANPDYPTYDTYDQLMRLEEWLPHLDLEEDRA